MIQSDGGVRIGMGLAGMGSHGRGPPMGGETLGAQGIPWERGPLGAQTVTIYHSVAIYRSVKMLKHNVSNL